MKVPITPLLLSAYMYFQRFTKAERSVQEFTFGGYKGIVTKDGKRLSIVVEPIEQTDGIIVLEPNSVYCKWCNSENGSSDDRQPIYCWNCGHRAELSRANCNCRKCRSQ